MPLRPNMLLDVHDDGRNRIDVRDDLLEQAGYNLNQEQQDLMNSGRSMKLIRTRDPDFDPDEVHNRKSRIDAVLIQSRGKMQTYADGSVDPCSRCAAGHGPFEYCINMEKYCAGCCGNCKWNDQAGECDKYKRNDRPVDLLTPPEPVQTRVGRESKRPVRYGVVEDPKAEESKKMYKARKEREE